MHRETDAEPATVTHEGTRVHALAPVSSDDWQHIQPRRGFGETTQKQPTSTRTDRDRQHRTEPGKRQGLRRSPGGNTGTRQNRQAAAVMEKKPHGPDRNPAPPSMRTDAGQNHSHPTETDTPES